MSTRYPFATLLIFEIGLALTATASSSTLAPAGQLSGVIYESGFHYTLTADKPEGFSMYGLIMKGSWTKSEYEFIDITNVIKISNPTLEGRYEAYKASLGVRNGGEQMLFHGTENRCDGKGCKVGSLRG